jgi:hypothetical protein
LEGPASGSEAGPSKPVVYLAECGYDRGEERDVIETELRAHGYSVLPDRELPVREEHYRKEVAAMMERASLSVHLVGSDYGMVPYGPSGKSVPVLQNEIAIERSRTAGMPRIIWTPASVTTKNQEQQRFLERLQNDAEAQHGADLIISDMETVKATIHAALRKLEQPKALQQTAASAGTDSGARLAYLICDERDKEAVKPLRRLLMAAGYQVRLPLFTDDAAVVRQHHQELLGECELIVHYWGCGDVKWKATVETDLWKLKAYRTSKPLPKRCTIVAGPANSDKDELMEFPEPGTLDGTAGVPEEALRDLLAQ